jgi:hypothetical protein
VTRFPRARQQRNQPIHLDDQRTNNSLPRRRTQAWNRGIPCASRSSLVLRDPSHLQSRAATRTVLEFLASSFGPSIDSLLGGHLPEFAFIWSQTDSVTADCWMNKINFHDARPTISKDPEDWKDTNLSKIPTHQQIDPRQHEQSS